MIKTGDIWRSAFFALIGVGVMAEGVRLRLGVPTEPLPGFFPFVCGLFLTGLSAMLLARALVQRALRARVGGVLADRARDRGVLVRPAILVAALLAYAVALDPAGYVVPTVFLAVIVLRIFEVTDWRKLAAISLLLSVGTYYLFNRALNVPLPDGKLEALM